MDNSALAGYAIGSWLKNYIDRGQMRTQRERLLAGQANTNSTQSTNMPDVANTPGYGQATADTLSFGPLSKLAEVTQQSVAQQPTAQPDVSSMQGYGQATPQTLSLGGGRRFRGYWAVLRLWLARLHRVPKSSYSQQISPHISRPSSRHRITL